MVTEYGMSEKLGMINYGGDNNEVFIEMRPGAYENLQRGSGERDRQRGKTHHRRMLCQGKQIILDHEDVLHSCCALLMEKEKIGQAEFEALFQDEKKPSGS